MPPFKGNGSERAAEHSFECPSHNDDPSRFVFFFTMCQIQQTGEPCSNRPANQCSFLSWMRMVELVGIEPTTLCLQSRCSPS